MSHPRPPWWYLLYAISFIMVSVTVTTYIRSKFNFNFNGICVRTSCLCFISAVCPGPRGLCFKLTSLLFFPSYFPVFRVKWIHFKYRGCGSHSNEWRISSLGHQKVNKMYPKLIWIVPNVICWFSRDSASGCHVFLISIEWFHYDHWLVLCC